MKRIYFKRKGLCLKKRFEKDFFKMKRFSTSDEKEFYFELKRIYLFETQMK